jgi:hypothetical protein
MTTKNDLIQQVKKDNPSMTAIINGEQTILSVEDYEKACEAWADMRLAQLTAEATTLKAQTDKTALLTKLGITADEAKLLIS